MEIPRGYFSSCCGKPFEQTETWPRVCPKCGNEFWDNPTPVVLVLQPIIGKDNKIGLIVIRRGIRPCIGQLALPGGYMEIEHWREAGAREFNEECAIQIDTHKLKPFLPLPFESSLHHRQFLFFCIAEPLLEENLPPFVKNSEVKERLIVYKPVECCFNTHTIVIKEFFNMIANKSQRNPSHPA